MVIEIITDLTVPSRTQEGKEETIKIMIEDLIIKIVDLNVHIITIGMDKSKMIMQLEEIIKGIKQIGPTGEGIILMKIRMKIQE
jgi:hypothetical protein